MSPRTWNGYQVKWRGITYCPQAPYAGCWGGLYHGFERIVGKRLQGRCERTRLALGIHLLPGVSTPASVACLSSGPGPTLHLAGSISSPRQIWSKSLSSFNSTTSQGVGVSEFPKILSPCPPVQHCNGCPRHSHGDGDLSTGTE